MNPLTRPVRCTRDLDLGTWLGVSHIQTFSGVTSSVYLLDFVLLPNILEVQGSSRCTNLRGIFEDTEW